MTFYSEGFVKHLIYVLPFIILHILQVFEDTDIVNNEDKMRLFLIYYICSKEISETEVEQYANILQVRTNFGWISITFRISRVCQQ